MAKANPFRFSTKYQDDDSELSYYGLRYFSSYIGRCLNRDPISESGGKNLYCIGHNNLICFADLLGLTFVLIPMEAAPGTLNPKHPDVLGDTQATQYKILKFRVESEKLTCSYCAILHVTEDFYLEVTSIKPSSVPTGFNENGFEYIRSHEDRRADIYRRAHDKYLGPVKGKLDGVTLCCRHPASGQLGLWASQVVDLFNDKFLSYITTQNALVDLERYTWNYRRDEAGLIDGGYYTYEPGPMPEVGPLPELQCP